MNETCDVLVSFLSTQATVSRRPVVYSRIDGSEGVIEFDETPIALVGPQTTLYGGLKRPGPGHVFGSVAEADAFMADAQREPIESRVLRSREAVRGQFDYISREIATFDDALGERFVDAIAPPTALDCEWPRGVETFPAGRHVMSEEGSPWRIVADTANGSMVIEPQQFVFSDVGFSADGSRAFFWHDWTWVRGGYPGWSSTSAFVLLERQDDVWRVSGHAQGPVVN